MRVSVNAIKVVASYTDRRCRLDVHLPQKQRVIPLNLLGWTAWNEERVRWQQNCDKPIQIGIYNRDLDPLRPMDIVLAAQTMAENEAETIVFAPNENRDLKMIGPMLEFFYPLFAASNLKEGQSPAKLVDQLIRLNSMNNQCNLRFNWIASSEDATGPLIAAKMEAGLSLDEAIDNVVSPQINKYLYFYFASEADPVAEALVSQASRARLIQIPEEFYPLHISDAALVRDGLTYCGFVSSPLGPGVTFQLPLSPSFH